MNVAHQLESDDENKEIEEAACYLDQFTSIELYLEWRIKYCTPSPQSNGLQ